MHPLMHFHRNYLQNREGKASADEDAITEDLVPGDGGFPWLSYHRSKQLGYQRAWDSRTAKASSGGKKSRRKPHRDKASNRSAEYGVLANSESQPRP